MCTYLASNKLTHLDPTRGTADVPVVSRANMLPGLRLRLEGDCAPQERASVHSVVDEVHGPLVNVRRGIAWACRRMGARQCWKLTRQGTLRSFPTEGALRAHCVR